MRQLLIYVNVYGAGIISSIGNNVAECINALENSVNTGISEMQYLGSVHKKALPVAEVQKN